MASRPIPATGEQDTDLSDLCLEHAPLAMATVTGAKHVVRYVNPAFCRLMDKAAQQLVGRPFGELQDQEGCVTKLDRVYRTGEPQRHIGEQRSKPRPVSWTYAMWPVFADERPVEVVIQVTETPQPPERIVAMNEALILGSLRQHELTEAAESSNARLQQEIGERKEAEQLLRWAQAALTDRAGQLEGLVTERTAELTATNQQLEAFIHSIAHDLRAPLRTMQGFSALLVEEAGAALSDAGKSYAERIDKSAQFMDALLIGLLAFSRVSQQRIELTSVSLQTVFESVMSGLQKDIQEKNARVEASGPWPVVLAHAPTLALVLFNLTSNALKFAAPGVRPLVQLRTEERAEFVRVWVEDNGVGIAPDHQDQIFRLFTRLQGEKHPGTGIGLAIVQKGVERMDGRVGVESTPGHGSRFWFEVRKA